MRNRYNENDILRYCRQTVLKAMDGVRASMRGSNRLLLKKTVRDQKTEKFELNPTKGIDALAEDLIVAALSEKFKKIEDIFATYRQNPKNPRRIPFVAAKSEKLARQIVGLIKIW